MRRLEETVSQGHLFGGCLPFRGANEGARASGAHRGQAKLAGIILLRGLGWK